MGRILKYIVLVLASLAGLLVIAGVAFMLLFDPNDYREDIEQLVMEKTGRELVIEGDLDVSIFPWLAIDVGTTRLANGAGFGDAPFASFESARLSVRLVPLFRGEVKVGSAALDALQLNLEINQQGRSNWQDFLDAADAAAQAPDASEPGEALDATLDILGIDVSDTTIRYTDAQAGSDLTLGDLDLGMGRISTPADGRIHIDGILLDGLLEGVSSTPTTVRLETGSLEVDTNGETIALDPVEMSLVGLSIAATVEPFSYAGDITPVAVIEVDAFSLRSLMQRLDIEAPETADPTALGKVSIDASARLSPNAIALTELTLVLDDTTLTGSLSIPQGNNDLYTFELNADAIELDRYMAPATDAAAAGGSEAAPVEIPSELIRLVNSRGSLKLKTATLSGMTFENVELGLTTNNGNLRLHPVSATLFDGQYNGDVRINAAGGTPVMSVNEQVSGVQLAALAAAMFDEDNITGTINGTFQLSGRGADLDAIQRDLDGTIALELVDGAYEGTDIWFEMRRARAALRQEPAPTPSAEPKTRFSEVRASGPVTDGVFNNDNLRVEMPFMQISGTGKVNFIEGNVDYRLSARVLEKPEFVGDEMSEDELKDFTRTVVPIRVSGPITAPSVSPDVEKLLRDRAKKEVEDKLKDKLKDLFDR